MSTNQSIPLDILLKLPPRLPSLGLKIDAELAATHQEQVLQFFCDHSECQQWKYQDFTFCSKHLTSNDRRRLDDLCRRQEYMRDLHRSLDY